MKEAMEQYKTLLRVLHEMQISERGDSQQADAIRDEMDIPWRNMTLEEVHHCDGYSEGLYAMTESSLIIIEQETSLPV